MPGSVDDLRGGRIPEAAADRDEAGNFLLIVQPENKGRPGALVIRDPIPCGVGISHYTMRARSAKVRPAVGDLPDVRGPGGLEPRDDGKGVGLAAAGLELVRDGRTPRDPIGGRNRVERRAGREEEGEAEAGVFHRFDQKAR